MSESHQNHVPAAVRAAADRANALLQAQKGSEEAENKPADPGTAPEEGEPSEPAPAPSPAPEPDAAPTPAGDKEGSPAIQDKDDKSSGNFEYRYNAMKGRFEASEREKRALVEQLRIANREMDELRAQLAGMQSPTSDLLENLDLTPVSEEEVAEYGEDVINLMKRVSAQTAATVSDRLGRETAQLKARLESLDRTAAQTDYERMLTTMDREVPEWREINRDPEFLRWLEFSDPLSGQVRGDMLRTQYGKNNTQSVIAFFTSFLKDAGRVPAAPTNEQPDGKIPLDQFAAPGSPQPAAPVNTGPADKPIFTRKSIAAFYTDRANGVYRGREDEADRIERAIYAAQADGRVR